MKTEVDVNEVIRSLSNKLAQAEIDNSYKEALIAYLNAELDKARKELLDKMDEETDNNKGGKQSSSTK